MNDFWFQQNRATSQVANEIINFLKVIALSRVVAFQDRATLVNADELETIDALEENIRHVIVDKHPNCYKK